MFLTWRACGTRPGTVKTDSTISAQQEELAFNSWTLHGYITLLRARFDGEIFSEAVCWIAQGLESSEDLYPWNHGTNKRLSRRRANNVEHSTCAARAARSAVGRELCEGSLPRASHPT